MTTPRIGPSSVPMPPMITMNIIATTQLGPKANDGATYSVAVKLTAPARPHPAPELTNAMKRCHLERSRGEEEAVASEPDEHLPSHGHEPGVAGEQVPHLCHREHQHRLGQEALGALADQPGRRDDEEAENEG